MARPILTEKVSISLKKDDLKVLKQRAKRLYGGNLSALLGDYAKLARYEDGADHLIGWLTEVYEPGADALKAIEAEWTAPTPRAPKKRRARKTTG